MCPSASQVSKISYASSYVIQLSIFSYGLYRYSGNTFRFMNNFSDVKNVNCLYTDEEGRLWIGTNDNGVSIAINENIENTITEIEGLEVITPTHIERLFTADLAFLQDMYQRINDVEPPKMKVVCPDCGKIHEVPVNFTQEG